MEKIVLVTGGSSGIGKETAICYHDKGFKVYAVSRRTELMKSLEDKGIKILYLDLTSEESIDSVVKYIISKDKKIDILVNCAGYGLYGALEDITLAEAKKQFDVNLFGLAALIQAVLPGMRSRNSGRIINISSIGGKIYTHLAGWYHASKHALEALSDCLRLELFSYNISVVIVEPGLIKTNWHKIAMKNLVKASGKGDYKKDCENVEKSVTRMYEKGGSSPSVVAKTILKAGLSNRPRTRYVVGHNGKLFLFFKWILTDKMFDSLNRFYTG